MRNNALGITGMIALLVVALAAIAGLAWHKPVNVGINSIPDGGGGSGGEYGIIVQLEEGGGGYNNWSKIVTDVLKKTTPTYPKVDRDKLYRFRFFKAGVPQPSDTGQDVDSGNLSTDELLFDRTALVTALDPAPNHRAFTGYAFQIGVGRMHSYEKLGHQVDMPQGRGKINIMRESKKMVEEINDILSGDE